MLDCVFCKVISGEFSSYKVYEDEHTYAFLDIHPINRGHTLVIPRVHHTNVYDTPEETFKLVMNTVHLIAPKIKQAVGAGGINIGINNDKPAGQLVFHLHVHIIPRFLDDGHAQWNGNPYQEGEISSLCDSISASIQST